jgi:hypothetical protein
MDMNEKLYRLTPPMSVYHDPSTASAAIQIHAKRRKLMGTIFSRGILNILNNLPGLYTPVGVLNSGKSFTSLYNWNLLLQYDTRYSVY